MAASLAAEAVLPEVKQAAPLSPELLWFWETCLKDSRDSVVWIAAVWMMLAMGVMRFVHIGRSCITHSNDVGFFCYCLLGKSRKQGKRAPFRWSCPRIMPGGTDLFCVLSTLLAKYNYTSTVESPIGLIPAFLPPRAPFDAITGFGGGTMQLSRFHLLSRQIVLAAKPSFPPAMLSSYSARRLLPSIAELWHVPSELRNKIGSWNKDEVRETSSSRMPDRYSHFRLESALQVKTLLIQNLSARCAYLRVARDDLTWPAFCAKFTCDLTPVTTTADDVAVPAPSQAIAPQDPDSDASSTSSSSSSSSGSTKRPKVDDTVLMPWLMSAKGKVIHFREHGQPLCQHFTFTPACHSGSTMTSALATGLPMCNRCWAKVHTDVRKTWLGDIAP